MRRQLSPEQSSQIVSSSTLDPNADLTGALKEVLSGISEIYPAFSMRDCSSIWNIRAPGFVWDAQKNKIFYGLVSALPEKGFWSINFQPSPVMEAPTSMTSQVPQRSTAEPVPEESPEVVENLTDPWMREAINQGLDKRVAASIKKFFPQETWEDLLSEVGTLLSEWGKKGLCDSYIKRGQPPTVAILAVWAAQKVRQRIYGDATDALNREYKGLRTQTEMRKRRELKMEDLILEEGMKADPSAPQTVWVIREDDTREIVVVSPEAEEEALPEETEKKLSLIRNYIRVKRKRSPDRYARVFDFIKKGTPKGEAAVLEGCSVLTISHLYQKVREDLKEAPKVLGIVLRLLKKISDEPYSTLEEIQEENSTLEEEKISEALEVLLLGDLIREAKGKSFFPTEAGILLGEDA